MHKSNRVFKTLTVQEVGRKFNSKNTITYFRNVRDELNYEIKSLEMLLEIQRKMNSKKGAKVRSLELKVKLLRAMKQAAKKVIKEKIKSM